MKELNFPVYNIPGAFDVKTEGSLSYIQYSTENSETEINRNIVRVIDDKSIQKDTLGKRRIELLKEGVSLKKLDKGIFFLGDLIKLATTSKTFIDTNGKIFKLYKNNTAKLSYHKITNIIKLAAGGALLEVEGIPTRFKCIFAPKATEVYAGILHYKMSKVLYGLYTEKYADSWRRV